MNLPLIQTPVYEVFLPILKEKIRFRPFLVKEQKILMIAIQSEEKDFVNENMKQIIKNCCISEIEIDELSSLDLEFFFLHLRARSIGEVVEAKYRCENKISDGESCKNLMPVNINLLDIDVNLKDYNDTIKINDQVGIKFKYPNFKTIEKLSGDNNIIDKTFDAIIDCIDYIFDDNNFYYPKEATHQEMIDFIESLSVEQFKLIENYFAKLPKVSQELKVTCSKCGHKHSIILEGIQNFLD